MSRIFEESLADEFVSNGSFVAGCQSTEETWWLHNTRESLWHSVFTVSHSSHMTGTIRVLRFRRFWCHVIRWFFLVPRERSGAWALGSRSARNLDGQEHKLHRLHGLRRLLVVQLCSILKLCLAALFGYLWRCSWFFAETQSIWAWWAESSSFSIRRSFEGATSDTLTLWNTYFLRK